MRSGVFVAVACLLIGACQSSTRPPVAIEDAWSPATAPGSSVAAAYMQVTASEDDVLLSAAAAIADRTEMHTTSEGGGMMRMRPLDAAPIGAGETIAFEPGGRHFMLMGLHAPLVDGSTFPMTLKFRRAGEITIDVVVRSSGESHTRH